MNIGTNIIKNKLSYNSNPYYPFSSTKIKAFQQAIVLINDNPLKNLLFTTYFLLVRVQLLTSMLRIPRASLSAIYIKISSLIFGLYIADKNFLPVRLSKIRHTVSQNRGNFFISNLFLFLMLANHLPANSIIRNAILRNLPYLI